jgi:Mg2+ and Co2+ transporter CorA
MKIDKDISRKIRELEDEIRYNEAILEEVYEMQDSLFPIFADLVKLISKIYEEMNRQDSEFKKRITRLKEAFIEKEDIIEKYYSDENNIDSGSDIAYT